MTTIFRKVNKDGTFFFENCLYKIPEQFAQAYGTTVRLKSSPHEDRVLLYSEETGKFVGVATTPHFTPSHYTHDNYGYRTYKAGRHFMILVDGEDEARDFDTYEELERHIAHLDSIHSTSDEADPSAEADEMQEDDIQTDDGCTFYQNGKPILDASDLNAEETDAALIAHMERTNFYPNVWYISDHGNVSPWTWEKDNAK